MSEKYPTGMGVPYTPEPPFAGTDTPAGVAKWTWRELERVATRIRATTVHTHDVNTLTWGKEEDLRFPAQAINPPGAVTDPSRDTTDGTLLFASGFDSVIAVVAQMPHDWAVGTSVTPHIHWCKTTSAVGTVKWQYRYRVANLGSVFSAWSAWVNIETVEYSHGDTADQHALYTATPLSMTGKLASCVILFNVMRQSFGGTDTYGADAKFIEFDMHYLRGSAGAEP